jgi:hypothetical protein
MALVAVSAQAQVTPTPENPPPDDNPSVRLGGTLFTDYTKTLAPQVSDANGNRVSPSAFNVTRAYINVAGQLNHVFAFRITPDVTRETGGGSSLAGSETLRLKYGYVQASLDDWLWRGTYVRAGMIQTPFVDFEESVYRYRFQGTTFTEREGYMISSDFGVAARTLLPRGYGEVLGGLYNGEGYARADPNDQKAIEVRGTLRPFPSSNVPRGLRATFFYDGDHTTRDAQRRRAVELITFEHRYLNVAWSHLDTVDQANITAPRVAGSGQSFWITPRLPLGELPVAPPAGVVRATLEGLLRFDRMQPNDDRQSVERRWIGGVAYWPRMRSTTVIAAFLLDYERTEYEQFDPQRTTDRKIALHLLVAF